MSKGKCKKGKEKKIDKEKRRLRMRKITKSNLKIYENNLHK